MKSLLYANNDREESTVQTNICGLMLLQILAHVTARATWSLERLAQQEDDL